MKSKQEGGNVMKRREMKKRFHDGKVYHYNSRSGQNVYYRCVDRNCKGKLIQRGLSTFELRQEHTCSGISEEVERAKHTANERLKDLTLAAQDGDKAIDIVRKLLAELTPEVIALIQQSEDALLSRVRRWAKTAGIQLARSTIEEYLAEVGLDTPHQTLFISDRSSQNLQESDSCREPIARPSGKASDESMEGKRLVHENKPRQLSTGLQLHLKKKTINSLKLVDEEGRDLGNVPLDQILTAGEDSSNFRLDYDKLPRDQPNSASTYGADNLDGDDDDELPMDSNEFLIDEGDDYVDPADDTDFQLDCRSNVEPKSVKTSTQPKIVSTSSIVRASPKPTRKDAVKSGEKCFVCGDDLLLSEASSSSEETFRKACCYLNVKSKNEWFPRKSNGQFYSFCELCTNEIIRIQQLYKKVEEIQSLIFRRVEHVEKRIADAEIVDNWLADAPVSSAMRFEGFRKQVLINYKNKLKLRREIRVGTKMGHQLTEIQPITSAQMFANDPAETNAFRRFATTGADCSDNIIRISTLKQELPTAKRGRGCLKSKRTDELSTSMSKLNRSRHSSLSETTSGAGNDDGFDEAPHGDDDAVSVASEKEIKFWEADPSKLNLHTEDDESNDNGDTEDGNVDWMGAAAAASDSDDVNDDNDDDEDEDWIASKSRSSKRAAMGARRKPTLTANNKGKPEKPKRKSHRGKFELPDAVLTKEGRVFLSGIEIIKNAPGAYLRRPQAISYTCSACGKIIVNFGSMKEHICGHHLGMFKCQTCGKQLLDVRSLEGHIQVKHSQNNRTPCPICGRPVAGDRRNMQYHRYSHLGEEEKKDPKNQKYIPEKKKDPNRIKYSHGLQTFMCSYCPKTFFRTYALRKHELVHRGEGPTFQCQFCGKMYTSGKSLHGHNKTCEKRSLGIESQDSYPCPKCPTRFKTISIRNWHVKKFHGHTLPYGCSKCPRRFSTRSGFRKHKRLCVEDQSIGIVVPKKGRHRNQNQRYQNIDNDGPLPSTSRESQFATKLDTQVMSNIPSLAPHTPNNSGNSSIDNNDQSNPNASLLGGTGYNMFGTYHGGAVFQPNQHYHH